jgi:hypothetical protein
MLVELFASLRGETVKNGDFSDSEENAIDAMMRKLNGSGPARMLAGYHAAKSTIFHKT